MKVRFTLLVIVLALGIFGITHNVEATGTLMSRYNTATGQSVNCNFCHSSSNPSTNDLTAAGSTYSTSNHNACSIANTGSCAPPVIGTFAASPNPINAGASSTLSWTVSGGTVTAQSINNGAGTLTASARSISVTPSATATYTLTASNLGNNVTQTATKTVTVTVNSAVVNPPVIGSFGASPNPIVAGNSSTLSWNVTGATSVSVDNAIGAVSATGTRAVSPSATTTYTLTAANTSATGTTQTVTRSVTVTVNPVVNPPVIGSLGASPNPIVAGNSSTLSWGVTGATSVSIDNSIGTVSATGTRAVSPNATTTYTLTASNTSATGTTQTVTGTVTVTVTPAAVNPPVISSFTASAATITAGQSVTLSWNLSGQTPITLTLNGNSVSGTQTTVTPSVTTTYTLTATNSGGPTSSSPLTITVNPAGNSVTIDSFTASAGTITVGQSVTLSWRVTGATGANIDNGVGNITLPSGSANVTPAATTTYTLTASSGGTGPQSIPVTKTVTVTVNPSGTSLDMTVWADKWLELIITNAGYYVRDLGLRGDPQSSTGYLKMKDWDPENNIIHANLYWLSHDEERQWTSAAIDLHYTSGTNLDFECSSTVTDLRYGFTAHIKGVMSGGSLTDATFDTLAGYYIGRRNLPGWLSMTGDLIAESQVPPQLLQNNGSGSHDRDHEREHD